MKWFFLFVFTFVLLACTNTEVKIGKVNYNPIHPSVRGLFMVDENTVWSSGTKGVIQKISNARDWENFINQNIDTLDFRDIHAFDENTAIIMSSGKGCVIYKTKDGCKSWKLVYENNDSTAFFDGMDFWDGKNGIAFGDPINNQLQLITTKDGGDSWQTLTPITIPETLEGEAGFAASGTGIQCVEKNTVFIGTGGAERARLFISHDRGMNWEAHETPMRSGEASGIYSLCFRDSLNGVVVGGNYLDSVSTKGNCAYTNDGGKTWASSKIPPSGYRSCVAYNGNGVYISCGRTGVDVSYDNGKTWQLISKEGFYVCVFKNYSGWLFGRNGKYARITIE